MRSPPVVIGERASKAAAFVVWPVPPFPIGKVPVTPVVRGSPVAFVKTPEVGVPSIGVTKVGEVANTSAPLPVSSVTAVARFALVGVPRNVAMPAASPDTPVEIGSPVPFVKVTDVGVPRIGVTNVGEVARTTEPVPVFAVAARPLIKKEFPVPAVS